MCALDIIVSRSSFTTVLCMDMKIGTLTGYIIQTGFPLKQAARAWSPSVCVSQWGGGKRIYENRFLQKFHAKISKSQPSSMGQNGKNSENVIYNG